MAIPTKVTFSMVKHMEKAYIIGQMVKSMMVNGLMELRKDMECGKEYLVTPISVNGKIVKLMVMEFINGRMVIGTKDHGLIA